MISFRELKVAERRCLAGLYMDEPLNNLPNVGQPSIDSLIELDLIEESPETPIGADTHYRRTEKGEQVYEEMWQANGIPK